MVECCMPDLEGQSKCRLEPCLNDSMSFSWTLSC